jgi:hypothetical protein
VTYADAIVSLVPDAQFSISEDNYATLQWFCDAAIPSEEEIVQEVARLNALAEATEYKNQRLMAYPSIGEQLDLLYWDSINGTSNWIDTVAEVKERFPKP